MTSYTSLVIISKNSLVISTTCRQNEWFVYAENEISPREVPNVLNIWRLNFWDLSHVIFWILGNRRNKKSEGDQIGGICLTVYDHSMQQKHSKILNHYKSYFISGLSL